MRRNMTAKLSKKIALITGGTSGLGLAAAQVFVEEGAYVFITGRRQKQLDEAVRELGPEAFGIRSDVSDLAGLDKVFQGIQARKGRLDVLFANAGVGALEPLGEITADQFDRMYGTNVRGLLFTVQKALPLMPKGASIILNGSSSSVRGIPAMSVYASTKAAVRSLARSWTWDLKDRGIRVNVISPGVVPTPGYELLGLTKEQVAGFVASQIPTIPMGRVGTAREIAKVALFLASDDSSFVNGVELFADGGMSQV
jgi:NAD(P)-dependent dehydrogenase (short-subunit alcohol dehydrogenase family)